MSIKKTKQYKEACPKKQHEFALELQKYSYEQLVFTDETGIVHDAYKDKRWSKKGEQLVEYVTGKSFLRTNIIAGLCNNIPIASMIFTRSCNTAVFHTWIKEVLIKEVLMNNLRIFHKLNIVDIVALLAFLSTFCLIFLLIICKKKSFHLS